MISDSKDLIEAGLGQALVMWFRNHPCNPTSVFSTKSETIRGLKWSFKRCASHKILFEFQESHNFVFEQILMSRQSRFFCGSVSFAVSQLSLKFTIRHPPRIPNFITNSLLLSYRFTSKTSNVRFQPNVDHP